MNKGQKKILSGLVYKLVNLLVFEKLSFKMSRNWTFVKVIGLVLNFTYDFEVRFSAFSTF